MFLSVKMLIPLGDFALEHYRVACRNVQTGGDMHLCPQVKGELPKRTKSIPSTKRIRFTAQLNQYPHQNYLSERIFS